MQLPENSQSFNRYSYCFNNPLKYTDPTGQLFGIDDVALFFAAASLYQSVMTAAVTGESVWKAAGISILSSAASYGIGGLFSGPLQGISGTFGGELLRAGAHGLASGVTSALSGENFGRGFASGFASSAMGSFGSCVDMNDGLMLASCAAMGGLTEWALGGDFLQGAMNGFTIGALNHMQHDPGSETEGNKIYSRERIKKDSKYKRKVMNEIQKDGKLSFAEAYYWYGYGDGSDITVDASKLDLGTIDVTGKKVGDSWPLPTLTLSGNKDVGLVYGHLTVEYMGNNSFRIWPDTYNFEIHTDNFFKWSTIKRNLETIGAKILHGTGTPFNINFKGLYYNR